MQVPTTQPPCNKPNPAVGVSRMRMSPTGRFLATLNDAQRCALWLWDLQDLALVCLLQHQQPVAAFEWEPRHDKLAVCTSGRRCAFAPHPHRGSSEPRNCSSCPIRI